MGQTGVACSVADRVLLSPAIAPSQRNSQRIHTPSASAPPRGKLKWLDQHANRPKAALLTLAPGEPPLAERENSLLRILLAEEGLTDVTPKFNVDLSQTLGRAHVRPHCPTITPRGKILIGALRRTLTCWDKCTLNLVPVSQLV